MTYKVILNSKDIDFEIIIYLYTTIWLELTSVVNALCFIIIEIMNYLPSKKNLASKNLNLKVYAESKWLF